MSMANPEFNQTRSIQNMSAREGGFNVNYSDSHSVHQVASSVHSTPGRSHITQITLPLKSERQVTLNGANFHVTVDANDIRL